MEIKKSEKVNLEKGKTLSLMMGAIVALAIMFVSFEWGTRDIQIIKYGGVADIFVEEEMDIIIPEDTPPPPPPPTPVVVNDLNIVEDHTPVEQIDIISSEDSPSSAQPETYLIPDINDKEEESDTHIFTVVEEMPAFPGGDSEMLKFISRSIKYPVIAQENGIQGRVVCTFTINQDGSVVDAEVVRGINPSLDKEALRVIGTMPTWKPGKQRGKAVRVRYTLPIVFRLQ